MPDCFQAKDLNTTKNCNFCEKKEDLPGLPDFFGTTYISKRVKIYQVTIKCSKWPQNIPERHKIDEMDLKYTNVFHYKPLQNGSISGFLV
jgi:hypothetical protein